MILERTSANRFRLATVSTSRLARLLGDWSHGDGPLHEQLVFHTRILIESGALTTGTRLPSERALALALSVSRNTVTKALDLLRGDGLVSSRQGDGTYVTYNRKTQSSRGDDRLRSFGDSPQLDRIDLRSAALPGLPMVAEELNLLDGSRMRQLVAHHGYIPSGLPELRETIAAYYRALGLPTDANSILITSGAQQALRLAAAALISPGSTVVIEEPSFRGAIESLRSLDAELVGVSSGSDGIDVDALASVVASMEPALIVLQSTVHNPTGSVMDGFHRSRVTAIAERHGVPVIDDATLADTILDGDRRPLPLAAGSELVVTVGSVSKSFWGGLRVGWVRAKPEFIDALVAVKGGEDLGTSVVAQLVAAQLLPQIERARDERLRTLTESRRLAIEKLRDVLPDWTPQVPAGGGSLWIALPRPGATAFAQRAERHGVQVLPGPTFSARDALDDWVRVSYAADVDRVVSGIELLAAVWADEAN